MTTMTDAQALEILALVDCPPCENQWARGRDLREVLLECFTPPPRALSEYPDGPLAYIPPALAAWLAEDAQAYAAMIAARRAVMGMWV